MNSKLNHSLVAFLVLILISGFRAEVGGQSVPTKNATQETSTEVSNVQSIAHENLQPSQVVEKAQHDFGEVQLGTSARHTFTLKNPTEKLMKIGEISQSCGCTVPEISSKEIKPGESVDVVVAIRTEAFRGRKESTIHVRFTEPSNFEVQLKAVVTIRNLTVEPEPIVFRSVKVGVPAKQVIKVTRHGSPFWKITKVTTGSDKLKGNIVNRKIQGNVVTFEIECETIETEVGQRSDRLIVHSNDTGEPEYSIPVHIEVENDVTVSVESIEFGQDGEQDGKPRRFFVKTAEPSEIVSLEVTPTGMLAKASPGKKKVHTIEVVRETKEDFEGVLRIKTDFSESTITIPVIAKKVQ